MYGEETSPEMLASSESTEDKERGNCWAIMGITNTNSPNRIIVLCVEISFIEKNNSLYGWQWIGWKDIT